MRYPRRLFQTPEKWGLEMYWVSERELRRMIAELRKDDPDGQFATISERDAIPWTFVGGDGWYECQVGKVKYRARFRWSRHTECWLPIEPVEISFQESRVGEGGACVEVRS